MEWIKLALDYIRTPRFNPLGMTGANKSVMAFNLSFLFDMSEMFDQCMSETLQWIADGKLKIVALDEIPLTEVREAHAKLESAQTVGKLILNTRR